MTDQKNDCNLNNLPNGSTNGNVSSMSMKCYQQNTEYPNAPGFFYGNMDSGTSNINGYNAMLNPNFPSYSSGMVLCGNQPGASMPNLGYHTPMQRHLPNSGQSGGHFTQPSYDGDPGKKSHFDEKVSGSSTSGIGSRSTTPMASSNSPMPHQSTSTQSSVPSIGNNPSLSMAQQQQPIQVSTGVAPCYPPLPMYSNNAPPYPMHPSNIGIMPQRFPIYCVPPFPPGQLSQLHPPAGNTALRFLNPTLQTNGGKSSPQLNASSGVPENAQSLASAVSTSIANSIASSLGSSNYPLGPTIPAHHLRGPSTVLPSGAGNLNRPPGYPSQYYISHPQQSYMQQQSQQPPMSYMGPATPSSLQTHSSNANNGATEPSSLSQSQMRPSSISSGNPSSAVHSIGGPPGSFLSSPHLMSHPLGMPMIPPNIPMGSFNGMSGTVSSQQPGFSNTMPYPGGTHFQGNLSSQYASQPPSSNIVTNEPSHSKGGRRKEIKPDGRSSPSKRSQKSESSLKKSKSQKNDLLIPPSPQNSMSSQLDFNESHSFVSSPSLSVSQPSLLSTGGDKATPGGSSSSQIMMSSYTNMQGNHSTPNLGKSMPMPMSLNSTPPSAMTASSTNISQTVNIPSHITGNIRKLFILGDEPDRCSWLEHYLKFMNDIGKPVVAMPHVAKIQLDLYKLYQVVQKNGGIMEVVRRRLWKEISQAVDVSSSAAAAFTLRRNYIRFLIDYECRFSLGGVDPEPLINQIEATAAKKKRKVVPQASTAPSGSQSGTSSLEKQLQRPGNEVDIVPDDASGSNTSHSNLTSSANGDSGSSKMFTYGSSVDNSASQTLQTNEHYGNQSKSHFLEDVINEVSSGAFCLPRKLAAVIANESGNSELSCKTFPTESTISLEAISTATGNSKASSCKSSTSLSGSQYNSDTASLLSQKHENKLCSQTTFQPINSIAVASKSANPLMQQPPVNNQSSFPVNAAQQQEFPHSAESLGASSVPMHVKQPVTPTSAPNSTTDDVPQVLNTLPNSTQKVSPVMMGASNKLSHSQLQRAPNTPIPSQIRMSPSSTKMLPSQYPVYLSPLATSMTATTAHSSIMPQTLTQYNLPLTASPLITPIKTSTVQSRNKVKQEIKLDPPFSFPLGSVERVEINVATSRKRRLITADEFGPVELWRVLMGLKCGLLAEVTWALECLCIFTYDENASQYFTLSSLPNLLDHLVELFSHALKLLKGKSLALMTDSEENKEEEKISIKERDPSMPTLDLFIDKVEPSTSLEQNGLQQHTNSQTEINSIKNLRFYHDGKCRRYVQVEPRKLSDPLTLARWKEMALVDPNLDLDEDIARSNNLNKQKQLSSRPEEYVMEPSFYPHKKLVLDNNTSGDLFCSPILLQKEATITRCIVISTILRNLSSLSQNENLMAAHRPLLATLSTLLLQDHECSSETVSKENRSLLKPWITLIRENSLVILTHLSGYIHIRELSPTIAYPLLKGLTHLAICESSNARELLRVSTKESVNGSDFSITPQRLALEALARLCVLEGNVDHILGTPSGGEVQRLFDALAHNVSPSNKDQFVREVSLIILSYLSRSWDFLGTHLICNAKPNIISSLLTFLEVTEMSVQEIITKNGFQVIMRNPELMGTSLDLLRRIGALIECLGQLPVNHSYFTEEHVFRLLNLSTSRVLDHQVVRSLINLLFRLHQHQPSLSISESAKCVVSTDKSEIYKSAPEDPKENVEVDNDATHLVRILLPTMEPSLSSSPINFETESSPPPPALSPANVSVCSTIPLVI